MIRQCINGIRTITNKYIFHFFLKKPFYGRSMLSHLELQRLTNLIEKTLHVEGSVIELGVYRGGSLAQIAKTLQKHNSDKIVYGLDTFEGHPYEEKGTRHVQGRFYDNNCSKVKKAMAKMGLTNVSVIKGKFADTFPQLKDETFSFAHLNCNVYLSYKQSLEFLLPRMAKNGIIYSQDYNSSDSVGANKAMEEIIGKENLIIFPDKSAYYVVT